MLRTLALTGVPGSGKTTLMRGVLPFLGPAADTIRNNIGTDGKHLNYASCTIHPKTKTFLFGIYDGSPYDGTDRLGRNVLPAAVVMIQNIAKLPGFNDWTLLLEGDRLVSDSFLSVAATLGPVQLFCSVVDFDECKRRSAHRTATEDAEWLKTASPKVAGKPRRAGRIEGQDESWWKGRTTKVLNLTQKYPTVWLSNTTRYDQGESEKTLIFWVLTQRWYGEYSTQQEGWYSGGSATVGEIGS